MAAQSRFENIVKQVPVGIIILRGKEMVVDMANETYLQIVDRKEEAFVGRSLYESLPEVKEFVEPLLNKVYMTGASHYGFEFPVILNRYGHSELTYFNFVYQALREEDGSVSGVIVVANEVTQLVRSKQSIEESEKQFKNLVMQSPIAMTIFRGNDFIIESPNYTLLNTIWYKKEEEVVGKSLLEVFPELIGQKYPDLLRRVMATGEPHRENEALALVGTVSYYLDFEYAPLRDAEGVVDGIMVTVTDVTEKVMARRNVEDAKERLRLAVEVTGLANFDIDLSNRAIIHAPRLAEIFGHPSDTVLTHPQMYAQVAPGDLENVILKALDRAMQTGVYQYEARIILPNGNICWIKTQGKVIYDEQQQPVKIIGTTRDITEEKAFAQALEQQVQERTRELAVKNEILVKMNAELESFAYVSSHDLQEPLRKIQIFSERIVELEGQNMSAKTKDYFTRIERAALTMQTLINDLLVYSRTSNTSKVFELRSMDAILQEVKSELHEEIEEKKAVIASQTLGEAQLIPFQFKQLLTNLISNSLKFAKSDHPPVINITHNIVGGEAIPNNWALSERQYHQLIIADNGIGFDNEFKERIFEIFQRLNHRDKFKGTGIGLAIVKKIVDNHNGFIQARGEKGVGATFEIWFPVESLF